MRVFPLALLVAALSLSGAPSSVAAEEASVVSAYAWEAPAALDGPLAVSVSFDLGAAQACTLAVETGGRTRAVPILAWEDVGGTVGALYSTYTGQAHANVGGAKADTRTLGGAGGAWAMQSVYERAWEGRFDVTVVVPDAGAWATAAGVAHPALRLDLACERGFTVADTRAGREAVAFTPDGTPGGTGANVNTLLAEATLARGDRLDARFASPEVRLRTLQLDFGSTIHGALTLEGPHGARSWAIDGSPIAHDGGAGDHRVVLDYTAYGTGDTFLGVLYGMAPVESLHAWA